LIMKYLSKILMIAAAAFAVAACGGSGGGGSDEPTGVAPSISPSSLTFTADGGSEIVSFSSDGKPSLVSSATWCTASVDSYSNGSGKFTVTASSNSTTNERYASISVVYNSKKATLTVTQSAGSGSSSGGTTTGSVDPTEEPTALNNDAWAFSQKLGLGWNLGNHFDTFPMTWGWWDGTTPTQTLFTKLKSYGFDSVRIPVTWFTHMNSDFTVTDEYMAEVAECVGWARDAGFNVILNTHHDDADSKNWLSLAKAVASSDSLTVITNKFNKLWNQIATYFKDEGDYLIFESFNEMHDGSWGIPNGKAEAYYKVINYWNQQFVNTVRATGGNNASRMLGIPGYAANPSLTIGYLTIPDDSVTGKIAVAVHDYDPYDYTIGGTYDQWGHSGKAGKKPSADESTYVATLKSLYDTYLANNIPVYIGECGCGNKSGTTAIAFKTYYLEYTYKAMKSYGLAGFIWDSGAEGTNADNHAYINHGTGEFIGSYGQTFIETINKAVHTTSSNYTLKSVYNSAP